MALTWPIVLAILCGAALHAAWNALIKSGNDKALDTALVHALGAIIALPFMLWLGPPPAGAWPYIAASLFIHIGYYTALVGAYQHGELGLTYPIMRGFAPLLVALGSGIFIGEAPTPVAAQPRCCRWSHAEWARSRWRRQSVRHGRADQTCLKCCT